MILGVFVINSSSLCSLAPLEESSEVLSPTPQDHVTVRVEYWQSVVKSVRRIVKYIGRIVSCKAHHGKAMGKAASTTGRHLSQPISRFHHAARL